MPSSYNLIYEHDLLKCCTCNMKHAFVAIGSYTNKLVYCMQLKKNYNRMTSASISLIVINWKLNKLSITHKYCSLAKSVPRFIDRVKWYWLRLHPELIISLPVWHIPTLTETNVQQYCNIITKVKSKMQNTYSQFQCFKKTLTLGKVTLSQSSLAMCSSTDYCVEVWVTYLFWWNFHGQW